LAGAGAADAARSLSAATVVASFSKLTFTYFPPRCTLGTAENEELVVRRNGSRRIQNNTSARYVIVWPAEEVYLIESIFLLILGDSHASYAFVGGCMCTPHRRHITQTDTTDAA
jgi:hypothetical protein